MDGEEKLRAALAEKDAIIADLNKRITSLEQQIINQNTILESINQNFTTLNKNILGSFADDGDKGRKRKNCGDSTAITVGPINKFLRTEKPKGGPGSDAPAQTLDANDNHAKEDGQPTNKENGQPTNEADNADKHNNVNNNNDDMIGRNGMNGNNNGSWATVVKLKKNRPVVNRAKPKAEGKVKPIVVAAIDGNRTNALINALFQKFKGNGYTISNKSKNQGPKIMCENIETKNEVMSILGSLQIEYNTFAQNEEKKKSFIVRGFPVGDDDQIVAGISCMLSSLGYKTYTVDRFVTAYQKRNPEQKHNRLFRVMLPFLDDESALLNVSVIGSFHVKIEPMKGSKVVQCKNCQRYHHTAGLCGYVYRCVQCTGNHGPGQCPRIDNANLPVSCVNCEIAGLVSAGHTANDFRNCHFYNLKVEKQKNESANTTQPLSAANRIVKGNFDDFAAKAKLTAQASGGKSATSRTNNNPEQSANDDIKKQLLLTLIQLVQKL